MRHRNVVGLFSIWSLRFSRLTALGTVRHNSKSFLGGLLSASFLHNSIMRTSCSALPDKMNYDFIDSQVAKDIDLELMTKPGFSIDQLMELAGLSVANAIFDWNPGATLNNNVLVICGPGNNGGDGLVAARHLKHFGFSPTIICPKLGKGDLFKNLITQCRNLEIATVDDCPDDLSPFGVIIDAIFGFSFEGPIREPYLSIIKRLSTSPVPVMSVDVPSGDVSFPDITTDVLLLSVIVYTSHVFRLACGGWGRVRHRLHPPGRDIPHTAQTLHEIIPWHPLSWRQVRMLFTSHATSLNHDRNLYYNYIMVVVI